MTNWTEPPLKFPNCAYEVGTYFIETASEWSETNFLGEAFTI